MYIGCVYVLYNFSLIILYKLSVGSVGCVCCINCKFPEQNGDRWDAIRIGDMSGVFTQSSSLPSANGLTFAGWNQDHGEPVRDVCVACIVAQTLTAA